MKTNRNRHAFPAAVVAAVAALASSATLAETLQDAWALAIARDKTLAAAGSDVEGARAAEKAARGARWPSLDASAGYTRLNAAPAFDIATPSFAFRSGPLFKDDQYTSGSVQMRLPLYAGGQISAGIDAARRSLAGASENQQTVTASLKLDVAESYVGVLRAQSSLRAAESSVTSLSAHAADVEVMVQRESVPRSDLLAARVALANAEQGHVRAANSVEIAYAVYNRRLGEPLERSPELNDHLPVDAALLATPVADLIKRALDSRSELKGLSAQADALVAQSRAETGKNLPQLGLTAGYTHLDNQFLDRQNISMVGIGVTWNLFDGGQARNRAAALRSASRAAQERLEDLRSAIELQVRQAWLDVREAQARVKASREAGAQAEENLRMSRELYGAGLATNTQVLDAVTLQINAVNNRDNAGLDETLAEVRLEHAIGAL